MCFGDFKKKWFSGENEIPPKRMKFWKSASEPNILGSKRPKNHQDMQILLWTFQKTKIIEIGPRSSENEESKRYRSQGGVPTDPTKGLLEIILRPQMATLKAAAKKSGSWSFSGGSELFARADVEELNVMHL